MQIVIERSVYFERKLNNVNANSVLSYKKHAIVKQYMNNQRTSNFLTSHFYIVMCHFEELHPVAS